MDPRPALLTNSVVRHLRWLTVSWQARTSGTQTKRNGAPIQKVPATLCCMKEISNSPCKILMQIMNHPIPTSCQILKKNPWKSQKTENPVQRGAPPSTAVLGGQDWRTHLHGGALHRLPGRDDLADGPGVLLLGPRRGPFWGAFVMHQLRFPQKVMFYLPKK